MSVAYYIVLKGEIEGFVPFVDGKALGHASETGLQKLCEALKVTPLTEFLRQDPEELAEFMEDESVEVPDELPAEQWFTAAQGLLTVRALKQHLTENPKALKNAAALCEDLSDYEAVLERLQKEHVMWHLALDF